MALCGHLCLCSPSEVSPLLVRGGLLAASAEVSMNVDDVAVCGVVAADGDGRNPRFQGPKRFGIRAGAQAR